MSSPGTVPDSARFGRLESIDVWRGLAALAVVLFHMPHDAPGGYREHPCFALSFLMDFGYLGVPFFVIISGFCIHRKAAMIACKTGQHELDWGRFWKRRFWRLYPTYLAAILFSLVCAYYSKARTNVFDDLFGWDLATHLLLFHNLTDEFVYGLGNGAFWSLGMEEQLYGLYFFLFLMIQKRSFRKALYFITAIVVAWRLSVPFLKEFTLDVGPFHLGTWYQWPFQYCLHWTLGAVAVDAFMGNISLPKWCRSLWLAVGLMMLGVIMNHSFLDILQHTGLGRRALSWVDLESMPYKLLSAVVELSFAVSFFCLMNWGLSRESDGRWSDWANCIIGPIGRISYSLYLVHVPVLTLLITHVPFSDSPAGWGCRFALYLPTIMVTAAVFYWCVERHFLGAGKSSSQAPTVLQPEPSN